MKTHASGVFYEERILEHGQLLRGDALLIEALRDLVPVIMRANDTPGVSLALARHNKSIWEAGFGKANLEAGTPMDPDTGFRIGSIGKTFVAIAVMQLAERGVLDIHSPVTPYMPFEVVNPLSREPVTVLHLLTHTSGLAGWDSGGVALEPISSPEEPLRRMLLEPRTRQYRGDFSPVWQLPPGSEPRYSNLGISLLGLMIEYINPEGLSYEEYIERNIFHPLNMSRSQCPKALTNEVSKAKMQSCLAQGYLSLGELRMRSPQLYYECFAGQGALSVPGDVIRVLVMMLRGGVLDGKRILEPSSVRAMLTPLHKTKIPETGSIPGIVWMLNKWEQARRSFSHSGSYAWGWRSAAYAWPDHSTALAVSTNQMNIPRVNPEIHQIVHFIEDWLITEAPLVDSNEIDSEWAWKLSYCRGLLIVESTFGWLGIGTRPADSDINSWADELDRFAGSAASWSREGFLQGARDLAAEELSRAGIERFLSSDRIRVSQHDIEQAFYELGASPQSCIYPSLLHRTTAASRDW